MEIDRSLGEGIPAPQCPSNIPRFSEEDRVAEECDAALQCGAASVCKNPKGPPEMVCASTLLMTS